MHSPSSSSSLFFFFSLNKGTLLFYSKVQHFKDKEERAISIHLLSSPVVYVMLGLF